jgi:hypothetical protein
MLKIPSNDGMRQTVVLERLCLACKAAPTFDS